MLPLPDYLYLCDWQKLNHKTKRATEKGDLKDNIAEHHLKANHTIDWDSAMCVTYSFNCY